MIDAHQAFAWLVALNKWPGLAVSVGRFAHDIGQHGTYSLSASLSILSI